MTEDQLIIIKELIKNTVKETVNGKIDRLSLKVDEHNETHEEDMKAIRPFIQARAGGEFLFKVLIGAGSVAAAWIAIKSAFLGVSPL